MDLDDFVAQAVALKKTKKSRARRARPEPNEGYTKTKEMLRELALERCEPREVVLMITYQECECGERFESVNNVPLVKCVGPTLTHFKQVKSFKDMQNYNHLPRVTESRVIQIPYCNTCFANAVEVRLPAEDPIWAELMMETRSDV